MLERIRRFFREESVGVTIPVGVVLGTGLVTVVANIVTGFMVPLRRGFTITVLGVDFFYQPVLMYGVAWLAVAALAYALFFSQPDSGGEAETGMRQCPECKSDIVADATRCAFCTAQVTPVVSE